MCDFPVAILAILLTNAIDFIGTPVVEPALPYYLKQHVGASAFQINFIASIFSLTGMLFGTLMGMLSDRIGRKSVLLGGLAGEALLYTASAFCSTIWSLGFVRCLLGMAGATGAVTMAYIYDHVESADMQQQIIKWNASLSNACKFLGLNIGAVLYALWDWEGVCFVMAGTCAVEVVIGTIFWEGSLTRKADVVIDTSDTKPTEKADAITERHSVFSHFTDPKLGPLLIWQAMGLGQNLFSACLPFLFLERYSLPQKEFARFMAGGTVSFFVFTQTARTQVNKLGDKVCMTVQPVVWLIGLLLILCSSPSQPYVLCFFWLCPAFGAAQMIAFQQRLNKATPPEIRGEVNGLSSSVVAGVSFVGTLTGGALFDWWWASAYMLAITIVIARIAIVWTFLPSEAAKHHNEPLLPEAETEPGPTPNLSRQASRKLTDLDLFPRPDGFGVGLHAKSLEQNFLDNDLYQEYMNHIDGQLERRHTIDLHDFHRLSGAERFMRVRTGTG